MHDLWVLKICHKVAYYIDINNIICYFLSIKMLKRGYVIDLKEYDSTVFL